MGFSVGGVRVPFKPKQFPIRLSRRIGLRTMGSISAKAVPRYLYAGLYSSPGVISKVDLTTFTETYSLPLQYDEYWVRSLAMDGNYLYAACESNRVVKVDLEAFERVDSLTVEWLPSSLAIDDGYLYVGLDHPPGAVVKIDLSTFTEVGRLTFDADERNVRALKISDNFLYCGLYEDAKIVKVNLSTFAKVATTFVTTDEHGVWFNAIQNYAGYLYAGVYSYYNGRISKVNLSTFSEVDSLAIGGISGIYALDVYNGYLYAGGDTNKIFKVNLSTFTVVDELTLPVDLYAIFSLIVDKGYLYAGSKDGKIAKIDLSTFTLVATLTLSYSNDVVTLK